MATKHALLSQLPNDKLAEVTTLLANGNSIAGVGKIIQTKWGLLPDTKPATLEKAIIRWRDDQASAHVLKQLVTVGVVDNVTHLAMKVDVINELSMTYQLQKLRIAKLLQREEVLPTLMDQMGKEITRSTEILVSLAKAQMDTGILPRAPKHMTLTPNNDGSLSVTVNSEQQKIIDAVNLEVEETLKLLEGKISKASAK